MYNFSYANSSKDKSYKKDIQTYSLPVSHNDSHVKSEEGEFLMW